MASSSIKPFGHNRHGPKTGGCAPFRGELGPHLTQRPLGRDLPRTKWHLDPSSRLATIDISQQLGVPPPFGGGRLGSPSSSMLLGSRPTSLPSDILIHQPLYHNRYGPKIGGCALLGGGAGFPSDTMWPEPRPTSVPSGIFIHPAVCSQ